MTKENDTAQKAVDEVGMQTAAAALGIPGNTRFKQFTITSKPALILVISVSGEVECRHGVPRVDLAPVLRIIADEWEKEAAQNAH